MSAYYPQLSLASNYGLHGEYAYGPKLNQLIYDFGKTSGAIDNQKYLTESYRDDLMKTITEVMGNTLLAYSNVQRYQEVTAVTQKMITSLEGVKSTAELRLSAGKSVLVDRVDYCFGSAGQEGKICSEEACELIYGVEILWPVLLTQVGILRQPWCFWGLRHNGTESALKLSTCPQSRVLAG